MTEKQIAFADHFIICGNASEAARLAGYSGRSARQVASRNMTNASILAYIQKQLAAQKAERVAKGAEVMEFYTSVMRGQIKDAFGMDASLSERLKAADALMRRYAVGEERQRNTIEKLDALLEEMKKAAY